MPAFHISIRYGSCKRSGYTALDHFRHASFPVFRSSNFNVAEFQASSNPQIDKDQWRNVFGVGIASDPMRKGCAARPKTNSENLMADFSKWSFQVIVKQTCSRLAKWSGICNCNIDADAILELPGHANTFQNVCLSKAAQIMGTFSCMLYIDFRADPMKPHF